MDIGKDQVDDKKGNNRTDSNKKTFPRNGACLGDVCTCILSDAERERLVLGRHFIIHRNSMLRGHFISEQDLLFGKCRIR